MPTKNGENSVGLVLDKSILVATIKIWFSTSVMSELPDTRANTSYDVKKIIIIGAF